MTTDNFDINLTDRIYQKILSDDNYIFLKKNFKLIKSLLVCIEVARKKFNLYITKRNIIDSHLLSNNSADLIFLEFLVYLSFLNINMNAINSLKNNKLVILGSNYGIEVIVLRMLLFDAVGLEKGSELVELSYVFYSMVLEELNEEEYIIKEYETTFKRKFTLIPDKINIYADYFLPSDVINECAGLIFARKIEPMTDIIKLIDNLKIELKNSSAIIILNYDSTFYENFVFDIINPKGKIFLAYKLQENIDKLYLHYFRAKNTSRTFLHICK